MLRGAFGTVLRSSVCLPECPDPRACPAKSTCPYATIFTPGARGSGPSGFADLPRPFVFRAAHLDGATYEPGMRFHFDLNLFDLSSYTRIVQTLANLSEHGLGSERSKVELETVTGDPVEIDLNANPIAVHYLRVIFLTPTELKGGTVPDFRLLTARIRDRLSLLRGQYGEGPLPIDYQDFADRASRVTMTRCQINPVSVRRRSSRTGQTHSIGGFIGEADYQGDLGEFVSFFRAATFTGVGRQTVWGKGQIQIDY